MTMGKAREGRRDNKSLGGKPPPDDPELEVEPADLVDDDEVGPQGGYGGSGPDQSKPKP